MIRAWVYAVLLFPFGILWSCEAEDEAADLSQRFIVAARCSDDLAQCRALSHEGVVWTLKMFPIAQMMQQMRQLGSLTRQIALPDSTFQMLEMLLDLNQSEATIQGRAVQGDFSRLIRQVDQLDAFTVFGTSRLSDKPPRMVMAIDLRNRQACIVHISELTINDQVASPPQPLLNEILEALQLAD